VYWTDRQLPDSGWKLLPALLWVCTESLGFILFGAQWSPGAFPATPWGSWSAQSLRSDADFARFWLETVASLATTLHTESGSCCVAGTRDTLVQLYINSFLTRCCHWSHHCHCLSSQLIFTQYWLHEDVQQIWIIIELKHLLYFVSRTRISRADS